MEIFLVDNVMNRWHTPYIAFRNHKRMHSSIPLAMGERGAPCCAHIPIWHLWRFAETKWCDGFGHGNLVQWIFIWLVRILMSNTQKMAIFSLLCDEQTCNWLRVVHLPVIFLCVWSNMVGEEYTGWRISACLYVSVPLGYDDGFSTLIYNNMCL